MIGRAPLRLLSIASAVGAVACASMTPERGHDRVAELIQQRTGRSTGWQKGPPDDARVGEWVRATVSKGLTRNRAVELALVNNPELGTVYEELGISQADLVQAGLLSNPALGADLGFDTSSGKLSEVRLSLVQNLLDLFVLPLRKEIAREQFEADTLRVAHKALEIAAETEKAFVAAQANLQLVAFRRTVLQTAQAAAALADRQLEAGNISPLDHVTERAVFEQAKLELTRAELEQAEGHEHLNRLLGLWGANASWRLVDPLPPVPDEDPPLAHVEATAIKQRLDVASARTQAALLAKAVDLARTSRLFGRVEVGVDYHRDPDGPRVFGPNMVIELPIFDQRQAAIARLEAQHRQQERRLAGLAINVRSEVRLGAVRLQALRRTAVHYRDTLLPLREQLLEQSLLHYNGMFISPYQLLAAKQAEVDARRGYIEAVRDYWASRAELERALGGPLPPPVATGASKPDKGPKGGDGHEH